jgi:hypothetical protein
MTNSGENPVQELLASGLHRLAQPISSAMWAVELAKEPAVAPLPHLAAEMRRAAGILHAMRSVIEVSTSYPYMRTECVNDLLDQLHRQLDPALREGGIVCHPVAPQPRICSVMTAGGFTAAYRVLLEKFSLLGLAPAVVRESLVAVDGGFVLTLTCDSPVIAVWTQAQREHCFDELDPFELPGFDFSSNIAPELTRARAILGASGLVLSGGVDQSVMRFEIQGRQVTQ